MKKTSSRWLVVMLACAAPLVLRAEVELVGVISEDQSTLFSLVDGDSGARSGWLQLGQSFAGAKLDGYDPQAQLLWLRIGGQRVGLSLRPSVPIESVADALLRIERMEAAGAITAQQADAERRAAGAIPINILGAVAVPGRTWNRTNGTLAEFVAAAGGLARSASKSRVKVTRTNFDSGEKTAYQVDLTDRKSETEKGGGAFVLKEGDVVFVPEVIL